MLVARTSKIPYAVLSVFLLFAAPGLLHADSIFNFDSDAFMKVTPFSDTANGITATFSSPTDSNLIEPGFSVALVAGFPLAAPFAGNVRVGADPSGMVPLTIAFSQDVNSIALDFATETAEPFFLTAFENTTQVGQTSTNGAVPSGFIFPQGSIDFSGQLFNSVILSSASPDFAIDNVDVNGSNTPVPEPSSLALLVAGLSILLLLSARRWQEQEPTL